MNWNFRSVRLVALCVVMLVLVSSLAVAQTSRGAITGVVTDPTGAVISDAVVKVVNKETNFTRETKTNAAGIYRLEALNLGNYDVIVTAQGFTTSTVAKVEVNAARETSIDVGMKIGAAGDTVTVEGTAAVALQTTEQVRGGAIPSRQISDLPVPGMNSLNLMLNLPGVVPSNQGGSLDGGIGSVNGSRARSNNFMIDGTENNDISVAGPSFSMTNQDAIQEVSVQTSNFSAEFGRAGGAVINQVTKSGTNDLHGTAAFVYISQVFNASTRTQRNAYNPAKKATNPLKPKYHEILPSFTVGGPVVVPGLYSGKDKTFWFLGMQWDRYSAGGVQQNYTIPTEAGYAVLAPMAATCPNVKQYLDLIGSARGNAANAPTSISVAVPTGLASTTCFGGARTGQTVQVAPFTQTAPSLFLDNNHQARVDHLVSNKQTMMFRWLWDDQVSTPSVIGLLPELDVDFKGRTYSGAFNHNYIINNSLTNEFRFNYTRFDYGWNVPEGTIGATLPQINVGGLSTIGLSAAYPQGRIANNFQYQDTVSYVKGKHQMRMGVDLLRQTSKQVAPFNSRGSITYNTVPATPTEPNGITSLANFIDNYAGRATASVYSISFGSGLYRPNLFRMAFFFQDSWKITSSLTINAGLRYEDFGQPANQFKYPVVSLDPSKPLADARVKEDKNNFAPSVGFAWNPRPDAGFFGWLTGGDKFVLRGGYQVSYDTWYNNLLSNMAAGSPNAAANLPVPSPITASNPRGLANASSLLSNAQPVSVVAASDNSSQFEESMANPLTHRFSLGVQRELPGAMIMDVTYVGSLSRQLLHTVSLNPRVPRFNAGLNRWEAGDRLIPTLGLRQIRTTGANSNYNSMQVSFRRRPVETPVGTLAFDSNFTWARNMDTQSETFGTNSSPQNPSRSYVIPGVNMNIDYGPSDNHRKYRWASTFVWDIKGPKSGWARQVLGGWTLSGIVPLTSGTPYTPINGLDRDLDGSTLGDRPDVGNWNAPMNTRGIPSSACASGLKDGNITTSTVCVNPTDVRWIAVESVTAVNVPGANTARRNSVYTEGSISVNMNVLKRFTITETKKLEYRAEIFNIANKENFSTPSSTLNVGSTASGSNFLNYNLMNGGSRSMRMGLKFIF